MIFFLTTSTHRYTVDALKKSNDVKVPICRSASYSQLFSATHLSPATYIFTDLERLTQQELTLAAAYYQYLQVQDGFRVLNNPARARVRYGLLRSLKEAGLNDFDAYRADGHPKPERFPVFIRSESAHEAALTRLLTDQLELERALEQLVTAGHSLRGLVVIEFCAEPVAPDVYCRWGLFKIGDSLHLDHVVQELNWNVKWGTRGLTTDDQFEQFRQAIVENRFSEDLQKSFGSASIDYGRADFGLVRGRPQVYEINTNPHIGTLDSHRSEVWMDAMRIARSRLANCLVEIDSCSNPTRLAVDVSQFSAYAQKTATEIHRIRQHGT